MFLKYVLLLAHIISGVASTIVCIFILNAVLYKKKSLLQFWSKSDLYLNILSTMLGGVYYFFYYPAIKSIIITGPFDMAHHIFMESKEHLFIILLLLSVYLNIIVGHYKSEKINWALLKLTSICMLTLGLYMSLSGMLINVGARVGLELTSK